MDRLDREEVYSKSVKAGKRTYFFDVKATKNNDFYLTITESKKKFDENGHYFFEKHKIFLYKEDFEKFNDGFCEVVDYIHALLAGKISVNELQRKNVNINYGEPDSEVLQQEFSNIEFEDI